MPNNVIERNTHLMQTLDKVLESLSFDAVQPVQVLSLADGREVVIIQANAFTLMRLYASGRPDGTKPHGRESYYEYFHDQLADYKNQHGSDEGFRLTPEDWRSLFDESTDRYIRYLHFASIKRWTDVKRDTETNIAATDFARKYAPPAIAWQHYQYKGYMLMMSGIANAELSLREGDEEEALRQIDLGIQRIGQFCGECLREGYGEAENITRERYLSNLIEFRSDLESVEEGLEQRRNRHDDDVDEMDEDEERDLLGELAELLGEEAEE
jgi:hypothetical protein